MPLEKGSVGSPAFGHNVATEMKAAKSQKQAVAIAYSEAGERKDAVDAYHNACLRGASAVDHFGK